MQARSPPQSCTELPSYPRGAGRAPCLPESPGGLHSFAVSGVCGRLTFLGSWPLSPPLKSASSICQPLLPLTTPPASYEDLVVTLDPQTVQDRPSSPGPQPYKAPLAASGGIVLGSGVKTGTSSGEPSFRLPQRASEVFPLHCDFRCKSV